MLTKEQLKKIMPRLPDEKLKLYYPHLVAAMEAYEINTVFRMAAFLAQLGHESLDLHYMEEIASGEAYDTGPLAIKLGNTPEDDDDGRLYKGRGPIQLTGKANYKKFGDLLGIDLINNPKLASTPEVGFKTAGLYWKLKNLNALADTENTKRITKLINGGYNGLEDRERRYAAAKIILTEHMMGISHETV